MCRPAVSTPEYLLFFFLTMFIGKIEKNIRFTIIHSNEGRGEREGTPLPRASGGRGELRNNEGKM